MECDKLLRETLNNLKQPKATGYTEKEGIGIDINSKMGTALAKIAEKIPGGVNARINLPTLKNILLKEGVSNDEIRLITGPLFNSKDTDKVSLGTLQSLVHSNKPKIDLIHSTEHDNIKKTFDQSEDYRVYSIKALGVNSEGKHEHFKDEQNFLGWFRNTTDKIDGKPVHVLQEFQSDWAQGINRDSYPISHKDFKKLAIVENLDQTIKKGFDTMVIPIDRSGDLSGSRAVTKMYSDLQKGILPKIRKELARNGLKIDVKTKTKPVPRRKYILDLQAIDNAALATRSQFPNGPADVEDFLNKLHGTFSYRFHESVEYAVDEMGMEVSTTYRGAYDITAGNFLDDDLDFIEFPGYTKRFKEEVAAKFLDNLSYDDLVKPNTSKTKALPAEDYFEIKIHTKNKQTPQIDTRWDMLGLIGAMGLSGAYDKLGETNGVE